MAILEAIANVVRAGGLMQWRELREQVQRQGFALMPTLRAFDHFCGYQGTAPEQSDIQPFYDLDGRSRGLIEVTEIFEDDEEEATVRWTREGGHGR